MKYRTKFDLRKHFTAEQFIELETTREEKIACYVADWKADKIKNAPAPLMDRPTQMEVVAAHWIVSYGNNEVTFISPSLGIPIGLDDEHFEKLTKKLNIDGITYIKARHASVSIPARN